MDNYSGYHKQNNQGLRKHNYYQTPCEKAKNQKKQADVFRNSPAIQAALRKQHKPQDTLILCIPMKLPTVLLY